MDKLYKKSQGAIEFVILIGVVIFFFTMFFVFLGSNSSLINKENKNNQLKDIALGVQDEINLATKSSDGYFRIFKVPENIYGEDYEINITVEMIYIRSSDKTIAVAYPIKPVSGQIKKGDNTIRKNQSIIYLNS